MRGGVVTPSSRPFWRNGPRISSSIFGVSVNWWMSRTIRMTLLPRIRGFEHRRGHCVIASPWPVHARRRRDRSPLRPGGTAGGLPSRSAIPRVRFRSSHRIITVRRWRTTVVSPWSVNIWPVGTSNRIVISERWCSPSRYIAIIGHISSRWSCGWRSATQMQSRMYIKKAAPSTT
jgi:hypothetical protein